MSGFFTDHDQVSFTFILLNNISTRGPGSWEFNTQYYVLTNSERVPLIKQLIKDELRKCAFDYLILKINIVSITFA